MKEFFAQPVFSKWPAFKKNRSHDKNWTNHTWANFFLHWVDPNLSCLIMWANEIIISASSLIVSTIWEKIRMTNRCVDTKETIVFISTIRMHDIDENTIRFINTNFACASFKHWTSWIQPMNPEPLYNIVTTQSIQSEYKGFDDSGVKSVLSLRLTFRHWFWKQTLHTIQRIRMLVHLSCVFKLLLWNQSLIG